MIQDVCPGAKKFIQPDIVIRSCPSCGEEVEFFDYETEQNCPKCGKTVKQEMDNSCLMWCEHSEKCLNDIENRKLLPKDRADELRKMFPNKKTQKQ